MSLGYLSEIERGEKEASSELLAAICQALGSHLSEVLRDASDSLARAERPDTAPALVDAALAPAGGDAPTPAAVSAGHGALPSARAPWARSERGRAERQAAESSELVGDGAVSVSVRRNGPLRTTLHAVRTRPADRSVIHSG